LAGRLLSTAPERLAAATNRSGWRAANIIAPYPPMEIPKIARWERSAIARKRASIRGISWSMTKVSYFGGPNAPPLYQSLQYPLFASGETMIDGYALASFSPWRNSLKVV
jgi:hypothetical protein